ncbi:MAG TPA: TonB-dependent receptor plug domain-containing protein, partial [Steroidobacteraceae bacterium]|nr:TonB-dependent receptor plug domain-containing protein [Steroidobacteraceae bacterium]
MWSTRNEPQLHSPQPDLTAHRNPGSRPASTARLPLALGVAAAVSLSLAHGRACAQDAQQKESPQLQEVVVTAEFSQRTQLQRTPIAITAITSRQLQERGLTDLASIGENQIAPNVNLEPQSAAFGPTLSVFIRGVGQGDFDPALEPGVAIYVDDVYFGETQGANLSLLDLARVEVLRGPQGTLFGKNAEGGAIRLVTQRPDGSNSGSIEGTFGSLNRIDFRASYDMALSRKHDLYMRVAAISQRRDGFMKRLDYACAHPDLGASQGYAVNLAAPQLLTSQNRQDGCVLGTAGGINITGGRIALRWAPSDLPIEMNLSGSIVQNNSEAAPTHLI